ncbi:GC-rich sequence DNA-binding factor-like protein-domain-containing protein [Panaeolus papilionaceus]|nr:GC-rich sequence DNA-binding factor-like protein-domain-containing protein [Panaeolus papilionaceus]
MPRRKRVLDDGDDSDDSITSEGGNVDWDNDPNVQEERELFQNPYKNKRQRKDNKEDAIYGIFGDDSDEEDIRNPAARSKRNWTKAPAFVSSDKTVVNLDEPMAVDDTTGLQAEKADSWEEEGQSDGDDGEDDESEGEEEPEEDADSSDESEPSRASSPRVRMDSQGNDESEDAKPCTLGLGSRGLGTGISMLSRDETNFSASKTSTPASTSGSRGGIGSRPPKTTVEEVDESTPPNNMPSAFGRHRLGRETNPSPKPATLPASEMAHFSKLRGTFGAKMLEKMGWQAGSGLGAGGEGIVTPIETKLRPQKMGIAFKGFKERTEQSKMEARRRGEEVSDDEDKKTKVQKKKTKEAQQKRSELWKTSKKTKVKVEHKTYEQIIAEAGEAPPPVSMGQIIDATGAVPREVSSITDVSLNAWSPSNDLTRIPEVRHNIRLISDACKSELEGLAREGKALQERKKFVNGEDARLRKRVENEAELIARLRQVQLVADDITSTAKQLNSSYELSLEPFSPYLQKLIVDYSPEYEKYGLDEIVVAAITPIVRRMVANWDPLEKPDLLLPTFRSWRTALRLSHPETTNMTQLDVYGAIIVKAPDQEAVMSPFESLLWNVWLPRVRTTINNQWSPESPQKAIVFYEAWSSFLPLFIRDNILDQLILPKVQKAVANWNAKLSRVTLRAIVFPWLPYVGLRLEEVVGDARRKIKNLLRSWTVDESVPSDLSAWKDVFDATEWDTNLLKYIVPKLGATLRNDLRVNPRDQKMEPIQQVLAWLGIVRSSIISQIIETEFFPKWLDVLYIWLIQPGVSLGQVDEWYRDWKKTFPEEIRDHAGISAGFTRGLQLMSKALELGSDAPTKLVKPNFRQEMQQARAPVVKADQAKIRPSARVQEITFRSIVEEYASNHNLLFMPTGRAHELSRMPLFRVSSGDDSKRGLLIYILDDAVWAPKPDSAGGDGDEFRAITLEDLVLRVT